MKSVKIDKKLNLPPLVGNEKWWINKILTDLFFLCKIVLHHGKKKEYRDLNWIHKRLCDFIQNHPTLQKLILIFRDGLKSSVARGKLIQWFLTKRHHHDRGKAFIFCGIADLAEDHLEKTWKELVSNKIIQYLFNTWMVQQGLPPLIPKKKSEFESCSMDKGIRYRGIEIDIGSPDKTLTGHHYELGINDNLVNEKNSEHPDQRRKIYLRWQQQESILAEDAEEIIFETTWWPDDLSGLILHPEGKFDYSTLKGKVCEVFTSQMGYEVFYCPAEDEDGAPVFPEKVDDRYLERKRRKQGSYLYSALYLLQPVADEDIVLRRSYIVHYKELPDPYIRNLIIDMAGTTSRESSYTGMSLGDWDVDGRLHIPWAERRKLTPHQVMKWIEDVLVKSRDDLKRPVLNIGIEKEKYGIFLYDLLDVLEFKKKYGVNIYLLEIRNISGDQRVAELIPKYEAEMILSAKGLTDYEDEVTSYYKGKLKGRDILDTVSYHFRLKTLPKKQKKPDTQPWQQPVLPCDESFLRQLKGDLAQKGGRGRDIARMF